MRLWAFFLLALLPATALGQQAQRVPACGQGSPGPGNNPLFIDLNGNLCISGSSTGVTPTTAGTVTPTSLDVSTVTTGSTAVTAFAAGHRTKGGWLFNPGAQPLCINEKGTAGTATSGDTTCIQTNNAYNLMASSNAVSVNSTDSAHVFSGLAAN